MSGRNGSYYKSPMEDTDIARTRRKVRKGTRSCWECKRNKAKCNLNLTSDGICDTCRRRGVPCISQEFVQDPRSDKQQLGDRLGRVEKLVEVLTSGTNESIVDRPHAFNVRSTPVQSQDSGTRCVKTGEHELSGVLRSAWPCQRDLDIILEEPIHSLAVFHGLICLPFEEVLQRGLPSPHELLHLPPAGSHPVLYARKLLTLATFVQSLSASSRQRLASVASFRDIEDRLLNSAKRVSGIDGELMMSVEGVELLIMESMYHNNAGNLGRAYLVIRRALSLAQLLGLDHGTSLHPSKFIDQSTRHRIHPESMWFRTVQSDNYLSLMLGLPPGTDQITFPPTGTVEACTDVERLERSVTAAAARIIRRNRQQGHDHEETQAIDQLLLDAARKMPSKWWLPPSLAFDTPCTEAVLLQKTTQMMDQLAYYYALSRLHLPYLLRPSLVGDYEYNRLTSLAANREILSRFHSFRGIQVKVGCFCRGVDFLAFVASVTICLFHIQAGVVRAVKDGDRHYTATVGQLGHQRLTDRALVDRVLELMVQISSSDPADTIATSVVETLGRLLEIEARAQEGVLYQTENIHDQDRASSCSNVASPGESDNTLRIDIPHFGTLKVSKIVQISYDSAAMRAGEIQSVPPGDNDDHGSLLSSNTYDPAGWLTADWEPTCEWDRSLQGVDQALFSGLFPLPEATSPWTASGTRE